MRTTNEPIDFAIIGGGIAGTYVAWRILNSNQASSKYPHRSIFLFEGTERIGGRLLTIEIPGTDSFLAEMGAMRYTNTHLLLKNLVRELDLSEYEFNCKRRSNTRPRHADSRATFCTGCTVAWCLYSKAKHQAASYAFLSQPFSSASISAALVTRTR
jgi:cation diffusion facilitator CzcD-associated flavoprotein CzcO